jgi:Short C-terminal domain/Phospholipase_D-nuclease N-terminal
MGSEGEDRTISKTQGGSAWSSSSARSGPGLIDERRERLMNLGEFLWGLLAFFFWFMAIWIFIAVFGDIFRRDDLSGWGKAGWIVLIFVLPFIGVLIYLIARPKMTEQDRRLVQTAMERERRVAGYSAADEVAKLAQLRDAGEITADEYQEMKRRAMLEV